MTQDKYITDDTLRSPNVVRRIFIELILWYAVLFDCQITMKLLVAVWGFIFVSILMSQHMQILSHFIVCSIGLSIFFIQKGNWEIMLFVGVFFQQWNFELGNSANWEKNSSEGLQRKSFWNAEERKKAIRYCVN